MARGIAESTYLPDISETEPFLDHGC